MRVRYMGVKPIQRASIVEYDPQAKGCAQLAIYEGDRDERSHRKNTIDHWILAEFKFADFHLHTYIMHIDVALCIDHTRNKSQ